MEIQELKDLVRQCGVVGAGGAGFPTYVKIDEKVDTLIVNCAECEPLLTLHRQLLFFKTKEILQTLTGLSEIMKVERIVIGIKEEYKSTIEELYKYSDEFPKIEIHLLEGVYPMGDEIVLIYETTGRVVRPGGLPIEEGVAVMNVETVYNIYQAMEKGKPVTEKLVSVVAGVKHPVTLSLPVGTSIQEAVNLAGGSVIEDPVFLVGGPMMGMIKSGDKPITKTTNAILVLSKNHYLIRKKESNPSIDLKRAASICCQCRACTDLCPRNMLGHPIEPHLFMKAAANQDYQDANPFLNTMFCSSCGVCELYACPQELSPRTLMGIYKGNLRRAGVKPPANPKQSSVNLIREFRKLPEERLMARLDLEQYESDAPFREERVTEIQKVTIPLSQHIGAPAVPKVKAGDMVSVGDLIGEPATGLSVGVHSSLDGKVVSVSESCVTIKKIG